MARNKSKARKAKVELSDPSTSQANGQQSTNMKRNKAKTIKVEPNEEVPKLSKAQRVCLSAFFKQHVCFSESFAKQRAR